MAYLRKVKRIRQFITQVSEEYYDEEKEIIEQLEDFAAHIIHLDLPESTLEETETGV